MLQKSLSSICLSAALLVAASGAWTLSQAATIAKGVALHAQQELTRNNGSDPETLDPALASSVPANNIIRDLFEGLTAVTNAGTIVPGVAQTWKQTNATTWVFNLRSNAKWSNGDPVTADDFVYGIRRFLDPATASTYAATYGAFIANGLAVVEGKQKPDTLGVKALNKTTLEITTPFPVSFMPDVVSNLQLGPVHRASVGKNGKAWTKPGNIVSNGAYTLSDWQVGSKVVLQKNPQYWDNANVPITKVNYLAIEEETADVKAFESGENDWVNQLAPGTYATYKAKYPKEIRNAPMLGLRYYSLYNNDPVLKDVRVRKALSMVIDRDIMANKVTADGQVPAYGVIVRGTAGANVTSYDWATWPMAKRVDEAKKLLAAAGVKPGTKIKCMMMEDYPIIPLFFRTMSSLVKPYVAGYGKKKPDGSVSQ